MWISYRRHICLVSVQFLDDFPLLFDFFLISLAGNMDIVKAQLPERDVELWAKFLSNMCEEKKKLTSRSRYSIWSCRSIIYTYVMALTLSGRIFLACSIIFVSPLCHISGSRCSDVYIPIGQFEISTKELFGYNQQE